MKPLLTDFGFAKCVPNLHDPNETYCGSSAYAPIEILKGKINTFLSNDPYLCLLQDNLLLVNIMYSLLKMDFLFRNRLMKELCYKLKNLPSK